MAKFKVGDTVRIREDLEVDKFYGGYQFIYEMENLKGEVVTIEKDLNGAYFIKEYYYLWSDEMLEEFKEDKIEKTFREVVVDIKQGEVWENELLELRIINNYIDIKNKTGWIKGDYISIKSDLKFKIKREQYIFEDAFKAYEEGKEIESCRFKYKKINGKDMCYLKEGKRWIEGYPAFRLEEIRDKWYINETM